MFYTLTYRLSKKEKKITKIIDVLQQEGFWAHKYINQGNNNSAQIFHLNNSPSSCKAFSGEVMVYDVILNCGKNKTKNPVTM